MPDKLTASDPAMLILQVRMFLFLPLTASLSDLKWGEISDRLQLAIASLTFPSSSPGNPWGILGILPYFLVTLLFGGYEGIGGGDIKLAAAIGFVLGLPASLIASILGLGSMCLICGLITVKRWPHEKKERIPFPVGPSLAVGVAAAYFMKIGSLIP